MGLLPHGAWWSEAEYVEQKLLWAWEPLLLQPGETQTLRVLGLSKEDQRPPEAK